MAQVKRSRSESPSKGQAEQTLPDNILGDIFKALRKKRSSFSSHAFVSRRWNSVFTEFHEEISVKEKAWVDEEKLIKDLATFPSLTSLVLEEHSVCRLSDSLLEFLATRPHLKRLDIKPCSSASGSYGFTSSGLEKLFKESRKLRVLSLSCDTDEPCAVPSNISLLTELAFLAVGKSEHPQQSDFPASLPESLWSMSQLRGLDLCEKFIPVAAGLNQLIKLKLLHWWPTWQGADSDQYTRDRLATLLRLTALKSLDITLPSPSLMTHLKDLANLEELKVTFRVAIQPIPGIFGSLSNLHSLTLSVYTLEPVHLPSISMLQSLQRLTLDCKLHGGLPSGLANLSGLQELLAPHASVDELFQSCDAHQAPAEGGSSTQAHTVFPKLEALGLNLDRAHQIHPRLFQLCKLRCLDLESCQNLGGIPDDISRLTSLQDLRLWHCHSLRAVPDALASLPSLQTWTLFGPRESLPASIPALRHLTALNLHLESRTFLCPSLFGKLTQLEEVMLSGQLLEELPGNIGSLAGLSRLRLDCFSLRALPPDFTQLTSLHELKLDVRSLENFPGDFQMLSGLEELELYLGAAFRGFHEGFPELKQLQDLRLSGTKLESLPSLAGCTSLRYLLLGNMPLLSELPADLGKLDALRVLELQDLQKLRTLPASMAEMGGLLQLNIQGCPALALSEHILQLPNLVPKCKNVLSKLPVEEVRRARLWSLRPLLHRINKKQ